ncbi:MAG: glycerophosphodiester phosphodiesterase [Inquilinaceae bacterium]
MTIPNAAVPLIASHRGGAQLWTENSRTAFLGTLDLPVEFVEFDVQRSRDGVLVVFHDATLDRITDGTGPLADRTWDELRRLHLKGTRADRMLSLDDALALLAPSPLGLRLEIKPGPGLTPYPGIEAEIAARLRAHGVLDRVQLTSFLLSGLEAFAAEATPGHGLLWLVAEPVDRLLGDDRRLHRLAREAGADQIAVRVRDLTRERVVRAAEAGIRLSSFATHSRDEIAHAMACGVPIFTTDRPDLALEMRQVEGGDARSDAYGA